MPTFKGSPEEFARMMNEAIDRSGGPIFGNINADFGEQPPRNNAINLVRCSDGVFRPERKPMTGIWNFGPAGPFRQHGSGFYTTTGN